MLFDMPHFYLWLLPLINLFFTIVDFLQFCPRTIQGFVWQHGVFDHQTMTILQNSGIHSICLFGIVNPNPAMAPHHKKVSSCQCKGSNNTHHLCPVCTKELSWWQWRCCWSQSAPLELVAVVEALLELVAAVEAPLELVAVVHYGFMMSSWIHCVYVTVYVRVTIYSPDMKEYIVANAKVNVSAIVEI